MNNQQQLKALKQQHQLTHKDIAAITGRSWYTVRSWFLHQGSAASRTVSTEDLDKIRLANK